MNHIWVNFRNASQPTVFMLDKNKGRFAIRTQCLNKHKAICEQRLYINLCTQMKPILNGLPIYAYWPGRVFVHVGGIEVRACLVCVRVVCVCGVCVVRV